MSRVVDIYRRDPFTLPEARRLVPILGRITAKYVSVVEKKMVQLDRLSTNSMERISQLETEVNFDVEEWHAKVRKLGGVPRGLWMVDLDFGEGYYSWQYGEKSLDFWHTYTESFKKRKPIARKNQLNLKKVEKPVSESETVVSPNL